MSGPIIYWYRNDLRLSDLRGMKEAAASGRAVLACYILDELSPGAWRAGAASRWWLHHSLSALSAEIEASGGRLYLARGESSEILTRLAKTTGATAVHCSRQYEPWSALLEARVHRQLAAIDVSLKRYKGTLLWEPELVANQGGQPYKVFTPFWRHCLARNDLDIHVDSCAVDHWYQGPECGEPLENLQLLPSRPDWSRGWESRWKPGESGALTGLADFLRHRVGEYGEGRDYPARAKTSMLSAHLHFGELTPARVLHTTREATAADPSLAQDGEKFLSELGWREFSHHLLFHFPQIPERAFKVKFDPFPWIGSRDKLQCWQQGQTGYPIIDAGMRELWATGYMHNRVRMVAASFLCKHLLIDWRAGQAWFWDTLVDADLANNACGWQWVAGSGADASPYFRIFNPVKQSEKFDAAGDYVRRWVPELSALPDRYVHQPWAASKQLLRHCGICLGETYPLPLVDHRDAREAALAAYEGLRAV